MNDDKLVCYKVGQVLYRIFSWEEDGKVETETWIVRTIRGGYVYAVMKTEFTWGKRSKKQGDIGWIDDNISDLNRMKARVGEPFFRLHTTKLTALKDERKSVAKDTYWEPEETRTKVLKTLDRMIASVKPKKPKAVG